MKALGRITVITYFCISGLTTAFAQWTEPVRISSDPHLGSPRVAVVGDTLHVVAKKLTKLYYLRSIDNGNTWTDPICPVDTFYRSYMNDIVYSNGKLHIAFIGRVHTQEPLKLFTISSLNHGLTWEDPIEVYYNGWKYPRLAASGASGDTLFLSSAIPGHILVFVSYDNGESWSDPYVAEQGSLGIDSWPNILYSQGRIHLIYQINDADDSVGIEIYHRSSDDYGLTWSERYPLSTEEPVPYHEHSQFPSACIDSSGNIMALWFDYKNGSECGVTGDILGRISRDNGETWLPETRLTYTQSGSVSSCVVLNNVFYAVWMDFDFLDCTNPKLMYSESSDWGESWLPAALIYDSDQLYEHQPFLFYNNQDEGYMLHCIMLGDLPDDTNDLYYVRKNDLTRVSDHPSVVNPNDIGLVSYPNPFNSDVILTLEGSRGGDEIIEIFDIQGRLVRKLELNASKGGDKTAIWDARDSSGRSLSSGIYFARVETRAAGRTIKMIYMK